MNKLREIAYRLDPVTWVKEILKLTPTPWQEEFLRAHLGGLDPGALGAASRQDHNGGVGGRAHDDLYARVIVGDRLPGAAPERGSGAPRA
jgi:hypothetical protein